MSATVMKVEVEQETCCICGAGGELMTPEEFDAGAAPLQMPLRNMLLHLNNNKVIPEGRLCGSCATRTVDAYELTSALSARAAPPLSEKIRALRKRLHELTQKIDVFIVVGGGASGGGYSEEDIIMVEKEALAAAAAADEHDLDHATNAKGERVYQCSVCPLSFQRASELSAHVSVHPGDARHCCWSCGAQLPDRAALRQHQQEHHQPQPEHCNLCNNDFASQVEFRRHESTCPAVCPGCGQQAESRATLAAHVLSSHGRGAAPPLVCAVCFITLPTSELLSAHALRHRQARHYVCGYSECVLRFGSRASLLTHIRRAHAAAAPPPAPADPYTCECGRTFASASALKRHAHSHQPPPVQETEGEGGEGGLLEEEVEYLVTAGGEEGEEGEVEYLEVETLEDVDAELTMQ